MSQEDVHRILNNYYPYSKREGLSPLRIEVVRSDVKVLDLVISDNVGDRFVHPYDLPLDVEGFAVVVKEAGKDARAFHKSVTEEGGRGYEAELVMNRFVDNNFWRGRWGIVLSYKLIFGQTMKCVVVLCVNAV